MKSMDNQDNLKTKFLKVADEVKHDLIQDDTKAILIVGSLANSIIGNESDVDICVIKDGDFKHKPGPHFHKDGVAVAIDDIGLNYILENNLLTNYLLANKLLNSIIIYDRDEDFASYIQAKQVEYYSEKEILGRFESHWEKGNKILSNASTNSRLLPSIIFLSFFRGFCPAVIYLNKKSPTTRRMYSRFLDAMEGLNTVNLDNLLGLNLSRSVFDTNCEILKKLSQECTDILKIKNYELYKENENYLNMDSVNLFIAVGNELWNDFDMINSANFCLKTYASIIFELIVDYGYENDHDFLPCLELIQRIFQTTTTSVEKFRDEITILKSTADYKK